MTWTLDPAHSAVTFSTKHMMITTVRGNMKIRDFDLSFDPGDLTIRGETRPVVLDAEFGGIVPNMQGGERAAFSAHTKINRDDFGLTWNVALEQGGLLVSKDIKVEIDLAAVSSETEAAAEVKAATELEAVSA